MTAAWQLLVLAVAVLLSLLPTASAAMTVSLYRAERTRKRRAEMLGWSLAAVCLSGLALAFYRINAVAPIRFVQIAILAPSLSCALYAAYSAATTPE